MVNGKYYLQAIGTEAPTSIRLISLGSKPGTTLHTIFASRFLDLIVALYRQTSFLGSIHKFLEASWEAVHSPFIILSLSNKILHHFEPLKSSTPLPPFIHYNASKHSKHSHLCKCTCLALLVMVIPLLSIVWLTTALSLHLNVANAQGSVGCSFHVTCHGAVNASIGEKVSGQARAGSQVPASLFTWFGDSFVDSNGNGCWWTPPTLTLQCDRNQAPDHGFQIACDGSLSFNGQTTFYECPTGEGDEVNIYLQPVSDACHEITIQADNCAPPCSNGTPGPTTQPTQQTGQSSQSIPMSGPPSSITPFTVASVRTSPGTDSTPSLPTSSSVPTSPITVPGQGTTTTFLTSTQTTTTYHPAPTTSAQCIEIAPDRIVLTDKGNPDRSYPNPDSLIQISPNASSIFNFALQDSNIGRTCELFFLLKSGSLFNLTGTNGLVGFWGLDGWGAEGTTYNSMPNILWELTGGDLGMHDGLGVSLGQFECAGNTTQLGVLMMEGRMADTCFDAVQGQVGEDRGMYLNIC
ncbi:hypothetical protein F5Y18DRAFT_68628 [Xylariaceae sp. FL1019]|nr:hypothetical protein F5Y18DRAFT_68628 [Xylariaceae sp. FL1019]